MTWHYNFAVQVTKCYVKVSFYDQIHYHTTSTLFLMLNQLDNLILNKLWEKNRFKIINEVNVFRIIIIIDVN